MSASLIELGIGRALFEERVDRGLSIREVAEETRMRQHMIKAIEMEDYDVVPQDVGGIGLVATYARFLDVEAERYLVQLEDLWGLQGSRQLLPEVRMRRRPVKWLPTVLGAFGAVLLLGALAYILSDQYNEYVAQAQLEQSFASESVAVESEQEARPNPLSPAATHLPGMLPTAEEADEPTQPPPTPTPTQSEVSIELRASGRAWVQVTVDDKVDFSGIMDEGDRRVWVGRASVDIWAGNSGYLTVIHNGRNIGRLGEPGEIIRASWTST